MSAAKNFQKILMDQAILTSQNLSQVQSRLVQFNNRLSSVVISFGFANEDRIANLISENYGLPLVDLSMVPISEDVIRLVKRPFCERYLVVPLLKTAGTVTFAFSDPITMSYKSSMEALIGCKIEFVVARENDLLHAIDSYYPQMTIEPSSRIAEEKRAQATPAVKPIHLQGNENSVQFVDRVLNEAIAQKSSDIHFEQFENRFRIRFRIDGQMVEAINIPGLNATEVVSRIKILAKMDVSEKRRPQDGRIKYSFREEQIDLRVNVLPTLFGEKVVMRILDKKSLQQSLSGLGMSPLQMKIFKKGIAKPQGMVLVTGPTGSGKTTTLYSALNELNAIKNNISTAEDPVEFNLDGINQVQVNSEIGFTFAEALRAFLRQDPDVIMIGEIRDLETANMSYKAASTGHMVLSTLHTNDAISTISRLIDMGVAKYLVGEATTLVTAQRLLKKLCTQCKVAKTPPPQLLIDLGAREEELDDYAKIYEERGCQVCNNTGYKGRVAVHEILEINNDIRDGIIKGLSTLELKERAIVSGFITLRMQALNKLKEGAISLQELINSTMSDKDF